MNRFAIILLQLGFCFTLSYAADPDILITQDGESLKVYNLELSSNSVFYTLTDAAYAPIEKLGKSAVLIIKKSDGSVINLNQNSGENNVVLSPKKANPAVHAAVTHRAVESDFVVVEKKKKKNQPIEIEKFILVSDGRQQVLNMKVLSEENKTLSVWKPRKGQKYELTEYIIPEYVMVGDDKYTVEEIGSEAFFYRQKITDVVFPETLKTIRQGALVGCKHLRRLILPESIEYIDDLAFESVGASAPIFEQLYIPKGVKTIGVRAFIYVGPNTSWYGYFQGNLTCIPDFITTGNCTSYGIDEEAVEAYEQRKR